MENHSKKKIAPIIITIIMVIYFMIYFSIIVSAVKTLALRILLGIIPLLLGIGMVAICVQRIKEINGGEEDDLSKY